MSPDPHLLRSTERCLSSLGHAAHTARSLAAAVRALGRVAVDIVCLDSLFPQRELDRFCDEARRRRGALPFVFISPPSAGYVDAALPAAFQRGRDGVVSKPVDAECMGRELVRVLSARGARRLSGQRVGSLLLDEAAQRLLFEEGGTVPLTRTECRLLRCLMSRPGQYITPEALLEEAWGYPKGTSGPEIVRAHVSNLRRKLRQAGKDPQIVRTMPFQGYGLFVEPAPARRAAAHS